MQENIKNATDMAFSDNVADMQGEIESALQYKIINALEQKRIEIAMGLMQNEAECSDDDMEDSDDEEDSSEDDDKEDKKKGKKSVKEEYIEEKLSVSDGVDKWIHDFVHSDDPRFEGKSKKERIQMALGAFYAAKKGTNEEIEDLDELYSGTLKRYIDQKQQLVGNKRDAGISLAKKKIAKIEKQKKKYINARQWEEEVEEYYKNEEYVSEDSLDRGDKYLMKHNIKDSNDLLDHFTKKLGTSHKSSTQKQYSEIGTAHDYASAVDDSLRLNRANLQKATGITRRHLTKLHKATDHSETPMQMLHGKKHTEIRAVDFGDEN